jgi:hypothetical protein
MANKWNKGVNTTFSLYHSSGIVPTLVNLKEVPDPAEWLQDANHLYIGRNCRGMRVNSLWANPYKINGQTSREQCIRQYETYLKNNNILQNALPQVCYKQLGCWCVPHQCHGHILINAVKDMLLFDLAFI